MAKAVKAKLHKATVAHVLRALQDEVVRARWRPVGFAYDVTFPGARTMPASDKKEVYTLVAAWVVENSIDRYSLIWEDPA